MTIALKVILLFHIGLCIVDCRSYESTDAKIESYDFQLNEHGSFRFSVDTSDGFHHDADGYLENAGDEDESLVVIGSYSYRAPDGVTYTVEYTADKNGFQPHGQHIPQFKVPTPPPTEIPGVLRSGGCLASLCGTGLG